jgi:hypothetical protein
MISSDSTAGLQNAGQNQNKNSNNKSFQIVAKFKHLGTTLCVCVCVCVWNNQGQIKFRECLLSFGPEPLSSILSKNTEMKIYTSVIFSFVLYQCEILSLTLREENGRVFLKWGAEEGIYDYTGRR